MAWISEHLFYNFVWCLFVFIVKWLNGEIQNRMKNARKRRTKYGFHSTQLHIGNKHMQRFRTNSFEIKVDHPKKGLKIWSNPKFIKNKLNGFLHRMDSFLRLFRADKAISSSCHECIWMNICATNNNYANIEMHVFHFSISLFIFLAFLPSVLVLTNEQSK